MCHEFHSSSCDGVVLAAGQGGHVSVCHEVHSSPSDGADCLFPVMQRVDWCVFSEEMYFRFCIRILVYYSMPQICLYYIHVSAPCYRAWFCFYLPNMFLYVPTQISIILTRFSKAKIKTAIVCENYGETSCKECSTFCLLHNLVSCDVFLFVLSFQ